MMRVRKQRKAQAVRQRLAPLGLPLIGSAIIIALFAAANPVIEQNLNALLDFSWLRIDLGRMILWTLLLSRWLEPVAPAAEEAFARHV